jgi:hypothetical protein
MNFPSGVYFSFAIALSEIKYPDGILKGVSDSLISFPDTWHRT